MQAYPKQRDLQEQPPININWDKEVEVGLKLALFRINFHISRSFITGSLLVRRRRRKMNYCVQFIYCLVVFLSKALVTIYVDNRSGDRGFTKC